MFTLLIINLISIYSNNFSLLIIIFKKFNLLHYKINLADCLFI